jgi:hypothetical protein
MKFAYQAALRSLLFAGAALSASISAAQAAPIAADSTINFAGQSTCTSTACTFGNAIVTSGTGSFSNFTFGTAATFFTFTFSPFTPQQIYTTTNAFGQTASYATTSGSPAVMGSANGLTTYTVNDTGVASLTGYDDTPGFFTFTANQNGSVQGSFSATNYAAAVPEADTWVMMVLGLGVAAFAVRRRQKAATRLTFAR